MKKNCWEATKCGRHVGGEKAKGMGVCPVATEQKLNGIHEGINSGRACWVISGTLCDKKVQGNFADKFEKCLTCDFYKVVKSEENEKFVHSGKLLRKLRAE